MLGNVISEWFFTFDATVCDIQHICVKGQTNTYTITTDVE